VILAAGLTPAWQQIVLLDAFHPGEVNRAREVHWCASGKVLNAGAALHHLGAESLTLSLAGGQHLPAMERELAALGVPRRWIESRAATRVCTTILDAGGGSTTELVENARPVAAVELAAFRAAFAEEAARAGLLLLTGSLPEGTPPTYYRDLLRDAPNVPAILDVRGPELLAALEAKPFLVKPNREELARTVALPTGIDAELLCAMRALNARGAEWVVVTQGRHAVWATSADAAYRLQPPAVQVVNPIGCGDCFAAGLAWAVQRGETAFDALRFAAAAAAENAMQLLPARLDPARVRELAGRIAVERV